jgi:hypothetical protein
VKRDEIRKKREVKRQEMAETTRAANAFKIDLKGNLSILTNKRREMSASFKSITRRKRDLIADGTGLVKDKVPDPGHY